jgi:hypothetical protein
MSIYCTYITFYSGNKLPPFYIGLGSISKIKNGYNDLFHQKFIKLFGKKNEKKIQIYLKPK